MSESVPSASTSQPVIALPASPPEKPVEPTPESASPVEAAAPIPAASVADEPPLIPSFAEKRPEPEPFRFHGDAREYFRVWIVNTLLTVLTLGVFAAWAKVRKRRYLRGNTELMGHRFDYRAEPVRLLVGNILVVVMFLAYAVFGEVYPMVRLGALAVGLVLLPWVVVRSLAFNAFNTTYRGMRFSFRQTYGWTAMVYFGQFLFVVLTLGIYYPAWIRNRRALVISSHRLGNAYFQFRGGAAPFYGAYVLAFVLMVAAMMGGGALMAFLTTKRGGLAPGLVELVPFFLLYGTAFIVSKHLIYAKLFNHVWNHTQLDDHRFRATLRVGSWLKLQITNLLAIIGTAGLAYPWAEIRSARYALEHLHFVPAGPIETIERLSREQGSAVGETAAEFAGLDFGL